MNWGRVGLVGLLASVVTSFSDWLFMGVLFHEKYLASPEIYHSSAGANEPRFIVYSQLMGVVSCAALTYLCVKASALSIATPLATATIVWLAGPVVVLAQMVLWTKLHPLIGVSQSLGWLVRFIVTALLAVWLM
jgi:hypothetical protein